MHRAAILLAALLTACTGGPIDQDTDDVDTGDTSDTGDSGDTSDTSPDADDSADEADGLYEDCARAEADGKRLAAGNYNGTTDNWDASLDGTCVAGGGAGPEKLFAIDVPTDTRLTVFFRLQGNDARLYFVENCNLSGVCLASSNTAGGNATESLEWINSSGATETIYVVLDSRDTAEPGETWTLEVRLEPFTPPTLLDVADTCAGLSGLTAITGSDSFAVDMTGFVNDYNAGTNFGCTGDYSSGVDAIVPVTLADGATLDVSWGHPSCDASVYLVETCGDLTTCVAGEDLSSSGVTESFTYVNTTGRDASFVLVLDHYSSGCVPSLANPGTLDVEITPHTSIAVDTCAEAEAMAPVAPGNHYVLLNTATDDLDLDDAATSCTGRTSPGDDVFLPVSVPAGQELRARFTTSAGDAAVYVVTDCADADSCAYGVDGADPDELRWINTSGATADVFLVIDSQYPHGDPDAPTSGLLELDVFPPLGDIPLADRCADLDTIPRVGEGTHVIVMDEFVNNIDLGAQNQCTGWSSAGPDGMVEVRVRPGWTLDASYDAGCDGTLYLLSGCTDATCYDGDDSGNPEEATWTNDSGATQDVVVVMDAWTLGCKPTRAFPGELVIDLTPPPSIAADTCAAALALPPVAAGVHDVALGDAESDYDVTALSGCGEVATSPGDEVYVPVALEPGQAVELAFDPDAGDPSLYLLDNCDTTPVCLEGSDSGNPEMLYWLNDSASPVTVVAVIDTVAAEGNAAEPQEGVLEVFFEYEIVPLVASDTCAAAPLTAPGRYEIDLTGFADDLDLEDGTEEPCTDGNRTPGRDAFVDIAVPAGATISLEWDASISTSGITNGSLYLLSACDVDACLVGSDAAEPEQVDYTNTTGAAQTLTVGLDAYSSSGGPDKGILTFLVEP